MRCTTTQILKCIGNIWFDQLYMLGKFDQLYMLGKFDQLYMLGKTLYGVCPLIRILMRSNVFQNLIRIDELKMVKMVKYFKFILVINKNVPFLNICIYFTPFDR